MGLFDRFRAPGPEPQPDQLPRGTSGRGHAFGFLDLEELNNDLRHPQGHRIYDRMFRTDGDVRQVVQLICNPILSGTWQSIPAGGENASARAQARADFLHWALWEQMRPALPGHLATVLPVLVRSGMAPFETAMTAVDYKPKDGNGEGTAGLRVVPRTLSLRLPRTIHQFEQDEWGNLTRIKQFLPVPKATIAGREGVSLPNTGNDNGYVWIPASQLLYYRVGAEGDNWEGVSMLRPAYKHWLMKDKIERIDAIAQEREALGVPICYPPLGASPQQLDEAEEVLAAMRTNEQGYIVAPGPKSGTGAPEGQGWLFEVIGYERTGSGRDPQPSLKYHTDKIAAAFIAEFMRLGHGQTGARATAQVQADPFLMSVEALVGVVETVLNDQLVKPLMAMNFADGEDMPALKMSLVDSTSLSQLADFVLKLTQIGALLPDQELEDFLRARADLPPANPESVKKRKAEDDAIRREIVTGGGGQGDAYGANADPGKPHGAKPVTKAAQGGATGKSNPSVGLDDDEFETVTLSCVLDSGATAYAVERPRDRYRPLRPYEHGMRLDDLEDAFDTMPQYMDAYCGKDVYTMAMGGDSSALRDSIHRCLTNAYNFGADTASDEIYSQAQAMGHTGHTLDRGARDRGMGHLGGRADLAAERIAMEMRQARAGHDLTHGDQGHAQIAAEKAGAAALRRAAFDHGIPAIQHGRHDEAVTLAQDIPLIGARYVSVLDRNTCGPCREADDGKVRALDDPVRLARQPPNPQCESVASGFNRCRCVEHYEVGDSGATLDASLVPNDPTKTNWIEKAGGLPPFIADIAGDLISERAMEVSRAIAVAINRVKIWAAGGGRISPATQVKAIEALSELHAKEAQAHAG